MGAQVFTTASRKNHDFVKELGADFAIDYQTEDYVAAINDLTSKPGAEMRPITSSLHVRTGENSTR
jgi:NADPH:quinone reductase-like Zn-dependent oxidoreductase